MKRTYANCNNSENYNESSVPGAKNTAFNLLIFTLLGVNCAAYNVFYGQFELGSRFVYLHVAVTGSVILFSIIVAAIFRRPVFWTLPAITISLSLLNYAIQSEAKKNIGQTISAKFIFDNWPIIIDLLSTRQVFAFLTIFICLFVSTYLLLLFATKRVNWFRIVVLPLFFVFLSVALFYVHKDRALSLMHWEPTLGLVGLNPNNPYFNTSANLALREAEALKGYEATNLATRKNVVVFMGESLNPDFLGQFNYHRDTVPFISEIESDFEHYSLNIGRSTCAESICGVMSFLSSRPFSEFPSLDTLTVTEAIRRNGYRVNFILTSDHENYLNGFYGKFMKNQADFLFDFKDSEHPINSDEIVLEGLNKLPNASSEPSFTFVFFFSSHALGEVTESRGDFGEFKELPRDAFVSNIKREFSNSEKEEYAVSYSSRLRILDQYMKKAYTVLKDKGYLENADFFLLGDHGEDVAERGFLGHGNLTEGGLRIPFLWASNEPIPEIGERVFSQIDFAPTLLDRLNIRIPSVWRGVSLFSSKSSHHVYHELGSHKFSRGMDCRAVFGPMLSQISAKYINCMSSAGDELNEFYDLDADYFERNNLWPILNASQRLAIRRLLERPATLEP